MKRKNKRLIMTRSSKSKNKYNPTSLNSLSICKKLSQIICNNRIKLAISSNLTKWKLFLSIKNDHYITFIYQRERFYLSYLKLFRRNQPSKTATSQKWNSLSSIPAIGTVYASDWFQIRLTSTLKTMIFSCTSQIFWLLKL